MSEMNELLALWSEVFARGAGAANDRSKERKSRAAQPRRDDESWIRAVIETQIVPRLMLSHRGAHEAAGTQARNIGAEDVAELARIVVAHDANTARVFCEAIEAEGVDAGRILLDLFAPAARLLGELWASDRCTFADVTVGLSVLQRMMRERGMTLSETFVGRERGRAVLAPVPGEQHTLGLHMVADFLRGDGWDVSHIPLATDEEIVGGVAKERVDVLGLSVSNNALLPACANIVDRARASSANPDLVVVLGGACFPVQDIAVAAGADIHGGSAESTVTQLRYRFRREGDPPSPWPS